MKPHGNRRHAWLLVRIIGWIVWAAFQCQEGRAQTNTPAGEPPVRALVVAQTNAAHTNHAGVSMWWGVTNAGSNCGPISFRVWWGGQPGLYDSFQDVGTNRWFKFTNALSTPFPASVGTNYAVSLSADGTLAAAVGFGATSKTTNGFTITLSGGVTGGVTVDYNAWVNQ